MFLTSPNRETSTEQIGFERQGPRGIENNICRKFSAEKTQT